MLVRFKFDVEDVTAADEVSLRHMYVLYDPNPVTYVIK